MAGIASVVYNTLFKRTSTFALTIIGATFFFERAIDVTTEKIYDDLNQGKLWHHIKNNYSS